MMEVVVHRVLARSVCMAEYGKLNHLHVKDFNADQLKPTSRPSKWRLSCRPTWRIPSPAEEPSNNKDSFDEF
jgi:hypothetical protein